MVQAAFGFPRDAVFLVTGGAGFIGSNLCAALLARGHRVRCLDDLSAGCLENIAPLRDDPAFRFTEGDICAPATCLAATEGVDYVLHQAARISVAESVEQPLLYAATNAQGTLQLLESARQNGVRRVVYASSSAVYGDAATLPQAEGGEGAPLSPYALSKSAAEQYAALYTRLYGLETVGLRYFNVFGQRQDPNGGYAAVIPQFIRCLLRGERPTIFGDGGQSRDFTYVEDVVTANLLACLAPPAAVGTVCNIACGEQITILELHCCLCEALAVEIEPIFAPPRPGDVRHSRADIARARRLLGFEPQYSFAQGLQAAITWYRDSI